MADTGRPLGSFNITPDELLSLWEEYKEFVDSNPDEIEVATGKGVVITKVQKPYLRQGFESFVYRNKGFHIHQYIDNYKNAYDSFLGVVTYVRSEWQENQLSGALTGKYKAPTLIAKLNDIAEKTETKHSFDQGAVINWSIDAPDNNTNTKTD